MTYFYENLNDCALEIIRQKGNADDVKAERDLLEIENTVAKARPTEEFIGMAKKLDKRINSEYPEIEKMCDIASAMKKNLAYMETRRKTELEYIIDCLMTDKYGILASVLIKHKIIETAKEFIKEVK